MGYGVLSNSAMLPTLDHTWAGTIGTSRALMVDCGVLVLMTRVWSSTARTEAKFSTKLPLAFLAAGSCMMRLKVKAASLAVAGFPSDQRRPGATR